MPNIFPLSLYDSYAKTSFSVNPNSANTIKMYSCGPTVYQYQHIGNMRAVWLPESVASIAKVAGYNVDWVLNITDVGHLVGDSDTGQDKLEKSAKAEQKSVADIVNFYTTDFQLQCQKLGFQLPTGNHFPRATSYIEEQMILALTLLRDQKAYLLDDGIYFDSSSVSADKLPFKQVKGDANFTGRSITNTTKNPADFALWKFVSADTLQKWRFNEFDSTAELMISTLSEILDEKFLDLPNRHGCPGWHSECVAMICKIQNGHFLPQLSANESVIDLHFGGEDHIDIHHKNEIFQSEALGFHLSKHWIHNKFVLVDGKKMSKSLGNVYLVTGAKSTTGFDSLEEKGFDPLSYRLMLHEHHYTTQLDFTWDKLTSSQTRLHNLRKEAAKISFFALQNQIETPNPNHQEKQKNILLEPLLSNLNFPLFLEKYTDLLTETASTIATKNTLHPSNFATLKHFENHILKLNLFPQIPANIQALGAARAQAKLTKDYAQSDQIRAQIEAAGYQIDDYSWGYGIWAR
jgi:cysteinyl-tRNA synthetase